MKHLLEAEVVLKQDCNVMKLINMFESNGYIIIPDANKEILLVVSKNGNKEYDRTQENRKAKTKTERIDREFKKIVKQGRPETAEMVAA